MPRSLSPIYGADDNDFAQSIASDALMPTLGTEDIWGAVEDDRAQAQANVGKESLGPTDPKAPVTSGINKGTVRVPLVAAMPRHEKGPTTATATGGKDSLVPANQKDPKTGKQQSPAFTNETA